MLNRQTGKYAEAVSRGRPVYLDRGDVSGEFLVSGRGTSQQTGSRSAVRFVCSKRLVDWILTSRLGTQGHEGGPPDTRGHWSDGDGTSSYRRLRKFLTSQHKDQTGRRN